RRGSQGRRSGGQDRRHITAAEPAQFAGAARGGACARRRGGRGRSSRPWEPAMIRLRTLGVLAAALALALGGCSTVSKVGSLNPFRGKQHRVAANAANRIPIVALDEQLRVSDALKGQDFSLPPPQALAEWPLPGG